MDGLKLIAEAQAAGLTVRTDGEKLVIRGPKTAEAVASRLIASKPLVMQALTEPELPACPQPHPGCTVELLRRKGQWVWRQRRLDAADRAYAAWLAAGSPSNGVIPGQSEETAVERAERYRAEWERSGYPPGVTPKIRERPSNDGAGI